MNILLTILVLTFYIIISVRKDNIHKKTIYKLNDRITDLNYEVRSLSGELLDNRDITYLQIRVEVLEKEIKQINNKPLEIPVKLRTSKRNSDIQKEELGEQPIQLRTSRPKLETRRESDTEDLYARNPDIMNVADNIAEDYVSCTSIDNSNQDSSSDSSSGGCD